MRPTIKKTSSTTWEGTGFGTSRATYGVVNHPSIRIIRASHGWTAYADNKKFFGLTKKELEDALMPLFNQ